MRKVIEWFFSLFISKSKIEEFKELEANKMREELLEYKNKVYFNKLSRNATKKRL